MPDVTLADIEARLKRLAEAIADLRQDVTVSNLERANLERRVEALERHMRMSEER